jgi:2-amino-4-hydroxy-6-hydroxymethyldihydropteridine diphosphokinase
LRAGIALGSNLGNHLQNLRAARSAVLALKGIGEPFLSSPIYETEPVGTEPDAGAFLNAVIEIGCMLPPRELLAALQSIERQMGRPADRPRNAPRPIDLDILYCGDLVVADGEVHIPHPRLHLRRFVLTPLADIRPELILPGQSQPVAALLASLHDPAGVKLSPHAWEP